MSRRRLHNILSRLDVYYGWYILAAGFLLLFFQAGARFSFGIMFKPMMVELGWNRASVSSVFFLNMTCFALTLSIAGKLYDRWGPKWVILISTLFLSVGYACVSFIDRLWEFHIYYGILAAIGMGGASVPLIAALMSKWFEKKRGLVISLALSGNCIGQFVLVPFFSNLILEFGWRFACIVIGVVIFAVNMVLALFVIKTEPPKPGLKPCSRKNRSGFRNNRSPSGITASATDLDLKAAMKTSSFWLYLIVMFVCGSGDFLITTHLVPMVTDFNISPAVAANMLAWFGLLSMGGILIAGPVSDAAGNKIPITLTFVLRLILFLLILRYQNLVSFYIFAVTFGFTFLITAPLTTTLIGRLFGFSHIGLISGFITMIHHLGGGFWAYAGGLSFDKSGSYQWSFVVSAVMAGIAVICTLMIKE
ncbi:MAG: MFS transporter [Desulfobacterales bacterium]|nr:MAG: MFS transporter [Desulfobacterales bacterium]